MDLRDEFIARVTENRSFADIGGLWGTVNEKVSVAARHHAQELAMIDISPPESDLWRLFRERINGLGVRNCECISSDLCVLAASPARQYDVVHCSGVLYHHPNPVFMLECLRRLTRRHLVLTSAVAQETVTNELGTVQLPSAGAVFVPALPAHEREILRRYWLENAGVGTCYGISEPVTWNPQDLGPWWWLFTPSVMLAMATTVGFRVLDEGPTWNGNAYTALLEVAD